MIKRLALAGMAWIAVGTWAEARREVRQADSPAMVAGIEADLAGRHCTGVKIDPEHFRSFARQHGLSHEDFFMKKRSARLKAEVARTTEALATEPASTCERLWADYGDAGRKVPLLRHVAPAKGA
ncbi:hypothetical protein [Methylobacterium sp. Leaf466]|uniref:hypothetical protein n=1 Tax=Methylobacterium sp. Leaf466 TaxID=1736386 RepID=UPI000AF51EBE|nr:hypothetical protein [Methylobacterium sp. Leaf466]